MKAESKLSPKAKNALLYLVFSGKELAISRLDIKFRKELVAAKLVEDVSRKGQGKGKPSRRYFVLKQHNAVWDAISDEPLEIPAPPKTDDAKLTEVETLNEVLKKLSALMRARGLALADVVSTAVQTARLDGPAAALADDDVRQRILDSYIALAKSWYTEVKLADLRCKLGGIPKERVDDALRRLAEEKRLSPFPIENPRERTNVDDSAALVLGITHHHCVRIKES